MFTFFRPVFRFMTRNTRSSATSGSRWAAPGHITLLLLALSFFSGLHAQVTTTWTSGSANWSTGANWDNGVPGSSDTAVIDNGGTANLVDPGSAQVLTVGDSTGSGSFSIAGGALTVGLTSEIGVNGIGAATISSGSWSSVSNLIVGQGSSGTVTIAGGTVSAANVRLGDSSGTGILSQTGGMLTTGSIIKGSGSGTLTLAGGTLRATANKANFLSGFTTGDVQLGTGGVVIDSNTRTIGIATVLQGSGGLTKEGSGTLSLSGANSYTGATTINLGTLRVSGSIAASNITTVNSGGTLGGTGTVGATSVNGGTIAPGNSPGTLTVNGDFTATSGTLSFEMASPTSDQLVISGNNRLLTGNTTGAVTISLLDFNSTASMGTYTLISVVGTGITTSDWGLSAFTLITPAHWGQSYLSMGSNGFDLELTLIPEPGTVALLAGLATLGVTAIVRRRRIRLTRGL